MTEGSEGMPPERKVNILLVDDRPENLLALEALLSDLGPNLVQARSGREALRQLLDEEFAVILLDVEMPGMDGFETARLIRAREKSQHTPIIFLTAINKSDAHVSRGYAAGAVDYVFKPFEPEILKAKVAAFVELSKKTLALRTEIAQRRLAEERLDASHALLETINRALVGFISEVNPSTTFQELLGSILALTRSEYGFIGEILEAPTGEPRLKAYAVLRTAGKEPPRGLDGSDSPASAEIYHLPALCRALRTDGRPLVANDAFALAHWRELPAGHPPLRSFLGLPFYKGEQLVGMVGLANRPGGYDAELAGDLEPCLNTCAAIIDAYRNEQRRQQAEEAVRELNQALERRVMERTAELAAANQELEIEIVERKRAEAELRLAKEAAERANDAKSQFLATVSHELRTPLNSVIGFSDVLVDQIFGELNPRQTEYVHNILTSGQHLLQLINDILDLAKVEAGRLELDLTRFDIADVLWLVETTTRPLAEKKKIALETDLAPDLPAITADEAKFKQIMYNLLSNAIKFTPEGGRVTVAARLEPSGGPTDDRRPTTDCRRPTADEGSMEGEAAASVVGVWSSLADRGNGPRFLRVSVSDTGIGIRGEDHERVFGEFVQLDATYARHQEGTGLGLALTRKLIGLHGGRIWVESDGIEGNGSTFVFLLPIELAEPETPAQAAA